MTVWEQYLLLIYHAERGEGKKKGGGLHKPIAVGQTNLERLQCAVPQVCNLERKRAAGGGVQGIIVLSPTREFPHPPLCVGGGGKESALLPSSFLPHGPPSPLLARRRRPPEPPARLAGSWRGSLAPPLENTGAVAMMMMKKKKKMRCPTRSDCARLGRGIPEGDRADLTAPPPPPPPPLSCPSLARLPSQRGRTRGCSKRSALARGRGSSSSSP